MNFFTKNSIRTTLDCHGRLPEKHQERSITQAAFLFVNLCLILLMTVSMNVYAGKKAVPGMPGTITGQVNVCAYVGTSRTASYTINPVAGAELYLWTVPPTTHIVSGQGTTTISLTFDPGFTASANKQLRVRAISQEGNSTDRVLYLASQQPSTPNLINGPSNACLYVGTPTQAIYTTARDAAATGYIWGTDATTTYVTHPNGPGVDDTIIKVVFKSGYKTAPITVQAVNNCGFSASRTLAVAGSAPATPGPITGPTNVCAYMLPNGATTTYSINPVSGATSYTWITPPNCIVDHPNGSGPGDVLIKIQFPSNFAGGSLSVIASSGCDDSSPRSLVVNKLNPATPGGITPLLETICPTREYSYKLPSMPSNAVTVDWTVPAEALSITGQGTAGIRVLYPENHVDGLVTAKAVNNCASSATRQYVVSLSRCQNERGVIGNNNANPPIPSAKKQADITPESMQVTISPNPSKGSFKLQVLTKDKEAINLKLLDLQGREVKKMNVIQGQSLNFGSELRPGTYIIEVSQGNVKHTEKLLKL